MTAPQRPAHARPLGLVLATGTPRAGLEAAPAPAPAPVPVPAPVAAARHAVATAPAHEDVCLDTAVIQAANALVTVLDPEGRVVRANPAALRSFGRQEHEVLGTFLWDGLPSPEERQTARRSILTTIADGVAVTAETAYLTSAGERQRVAWQHSPVLDATGNVRYLTCLGFDVTEQRQREARLRHLAETDALTGLLNRNSFDAALTGALDPDSGIGAGLLFCDLDGFKAINDTHGHAAGDALLAEVARRLRGLVRQHDVVARLGGDEFVVLCVGAGRPEVKALATRVEAAVRRPFPVAGRLLRVGISVGTTVGVPGETPQDVLGVADQQMYASKAARRARTAVAG